MKLIFVIVLFKNHTIFLMVFLWFVRLETGNNSSVSEIEQPEVIEPIDTVSQDLTHEEITNPLGTAVESQPENSVNEIQQQQLPEKPDDLQSQSAPTGQKKHRRKGKKPNVQEDDVIDVEFASRLDMSCADTETPAPQIENAHVADYIR